MRFEEALKKMRMGAKAYRLCKPEMAYSLKRGWTGTILAENIKIENIYSRVTFKVGDILAEDWEIL